jgi:Uma2 family endonuclease
MQEYMENGCRLGFLIDPVDRQAFIYHPDGSVEHFARLDGALSGEPLLPGFLLPLNLFRGE